jgi:hypothetical protein
MLTTILTTSAALGESRCGKRKNENGSDGGAMQTVCPQLAPENQDRTLFEAAAGIERLHFAIWRYTIRETLSPP